MGALINIASKIERAFTRKSGLDVPFTQSLSERLDPRFKFFINNNQVLWERCDNANLMKQVFEQVGPVASILMSMAEAFVNGELQALYSTTDNQVTGKKKEWQALLDQPNPMQDGAQFFKQLYIYRKLFGWCYVLKIRATGFNAPTALWVLPNWLLKIEENRTNTPFYRKKDLRKVSFCYDGQEIALDPKDLILYTDTTNILTEDTWLPQSRLLSAQQDITLVKSILEAQVTLIQSKGAMGAISSAGQDAVGTIQLSPDQKEDLQLQWRKYGLNRSQHQMIFSETALTYTPFVFDVQQLQLPEQYTQAYKAICDNLHYPFILSPFSDQSTYNNRAQAIKDLYQDTIIPDAKSIFKTTETGLNANDDNVKLWVSYDHIEALQQSMKDKGDGIRSMNQAWLILWNNNMCTRNQWLEALNMDTVTGEYKEIFDKYKFELTPEQLGIIEQNGNSGQSGPGGQQGGQSQSSN